MKFINSELYINVYEYYHHNIIAFYFFYIYVKLV